MKTDLYTKAVLSLIAVCLTILVLKQVDVIPNAYAEPTEKNLNPNVKYGLVPMNADGSIDVNIKSSTTMDVRIESCSRAAFYNAEPIEVKINN